MMKILCILFLSGIKAFSSTTSIRRATVSLASAANDEVAALRAAAVKAREEADRLNEVSIMMTLFC